MGEGGNYKIIGRSIDRKPPTKEEQINFLEGRLAFLRQHQNDSFPLAVFEALTPAEQEAVLAQENMGLPEEFHETLDTYRAILVGNDELDSPQIRAQQIAKVEAELQSLRGEV